MFPRQAALALFAVLILSAVAAADIDSNSGRMGRSVLHKPVQMMEADVNSVSTATNFRPSTGLENALDHVSDSHGVAEEVLQSLIAERSNRVGRPNLDLSQPDVRLPGQQAPVAPVPEPASAALLASGLMSLGFLRRKR